MKICPLLKRVDNKTEYPRCKGVDCAWWDEKENQCCVKTATVLQTINVESL